VCLSRSTVLVWSFGFSARLFGTGCRRFVLPIRDGPVAMWFGFIWLRLMVMDVAVEFGTHSRARFQL
jgi:hypothetical protein